MYKPPLEIRVQNWINRHFQKQKLFIVDRASYKTFQLGSVFHIKEAYDDEFRHHEVIEITKDKVVTRKPIQVTEDYWGHKHTYVTYKTQVFDKSVFLMQI